MRAPQRKVVKQEYYTSVCQEKASLVGCFLAILNCAAASALVLAGGSRLNVRLILFVLTAPAATPRTAFFTADANEGFFIIRRRFVHSLQGYGVLIAGHRQHGID